MRALLLIASNTFKDAIRQKIVFLMAFVALALTFSSTYLLKFDLGHEQLSFIADFTTGALGFFGTVIAIVSVCQLFYSEFESRTATTLLSKPLGSFEFVAGKLLGAAMLLAVFVLVVSVLGCAMLAYTEHRLKDMPADILGGRRLSMTVGGFFAYSVLQFFKLLTVAAVATFICMVSRSLMFAIIVSFMACAVSLAIGSDFAEGGGFAEQLASLFFPNMRLFEVAEKFIFEGVDFAKFFAASAYSMIYTCALCAIGVWAFHTREI
jgi:ABC-type transport system involved in multi-copper enzyme maturation permease subunit